MAYSFKGKSVKDVRLAIHKNSVFEQGGNMTGYNIKPRVAQDELENLDEAQSDDRLISEPYEDADGNRKYRDTLGVSKDQMDKIIETGSHDNSDYYTFKADVGFNKGKTFINTQTIKPVEQAFDKEKHAEATKHARALRAKESEKEQTVEQEAEAPEVE